MPIGKRNDMVRKNLLLKFKVPNNSVHKISEFDPLWGGGAKKMKNDSLAE